MINTKYIAKSIIALLAAIFFSGTATANNAKTPPCLSNYASNQNPNQPPWGPCSGEGCAVQACLVAYCQSWNSIDYYTANTWCIANCSPVQGCIDSDYTIFQANQAACANGTASPRMYSGNKCTGD
jgi:hypothetical protein